MLGVVMLSVVMLNVVMLSVVMLSVVMLSVVMLNVVVPDKFVSEDGLDFVIVFFFFGTNYLLFWLFQSHVLACMYDVCVRGSSMALACG